MKNKIEIFKNEELGEVRSLLINGEPYFVAKDVSEILGYSETNALTKRLDNDEFISDKLEGMNMNSILLNESGLYNAIFGSQLKSAKRFRKWVFGEVLPSIRKHGLYITNELLKDKEKLQCEIDKIQNEYYKLENENIYLKSDIKHLQAEEVKIKEENMEFRKQRDTIFRLSVKTGQDESYLPDLALQVIREYILNNEEVVIEAKESGYKVKRRPIMKELNKLILRKQDIMYVLGCLRINIEDNYIFIRQEFMDKDFKPIGSLYL